MRLSSAIYRLLLYLYPRDFRRDYGELMLQLFGDCCRDSYARKGVWGLIGLWWQAIPELVVRVIIERIRAMRENKLSRLTLCALFLAVALGGWLAYADSRTNDTGIVAGLLLIFAAALGFMRPQRVALLALLIGLCIPVAHIIGFLANPARGDFGDEIAGIVMPLGFAFAGAYIGMGLRQLFFPPRLV